MIRARHLPNPLKLVETLTGAGVRCVEFTLTSPGALEAVRLVSGRGDALVGVGTVRSPRQAREAIEAGARFVVSPGFHASVVSECLVRGIASFPGALTPTEVETAVASGSSAVKVFPAGLVGSGYIGELRTVFPESVLIPSGGVDAANAPGFLTAGASAVSAGGGIAPAEAIASEDYDEIGERARGFLAAIAAAS